MLWNVLPAQLLRRPTTVWGRVDVNHPGEGAGYEGLLAAFLILVVLGLAVSLWIFLAKWRLSRIAAAPEGYEEFEELDHAAESGVKLLFLASQVAAPLGALGAFVLGEGYELAGIGLPAVVLASSLATFAFAILAWQHVGRLRARLIGWRAALAYSGGD